jgi:hypothetical protein
MLEINQFKKEERDWAWWQAPVIPEPGRLRQEDCDFEASLHCIAT